MSRKYGVKWGLVKEEKNDYGMIKMQYKKVLRGWSHSQEKKQQKNQRPSINIEKSTGFRGDTQLYAWR